MFRRKDYYIVWNYGSNKHENYTEIIRARNLCVAWRKVRRRHILPIYMVEGRLFL